MFGYKTAKCVAELEVFSAEQERRHGQFYCLSPEYDDEIRANIEELASRYGCSTLERALRYLSRQQDRTFLK
jgi:hypothetical protein